MRYAQIQILCILLGSLTQSWDLYVQYKYEAYRSWVGPNWDVHFGSVSLQLMEEPELTEEEAVVRAMAIFEAEERAKWIGHEEAIQLSQQDTAAAPTPRQLPPPPPAANVCPSPHVFIDLGEED